MSSLDDPFLDLNADGDVNLGGQGERLRFAGEAMLATSVACQIGDANFDGAVDLADLHVWNENRTTASSHGCLGDFDANVQIELAVGTFGMNTNSAIQRPCRNPHSLP